jgi:hypothetical protein
MTSIRSLALLLSLLSLAACEQSASPPAQPKTPTVQEQPGKPLAEKAPAQVHRSAADAAPVETPPTPPSPAPGKSSAEQAKPKPAVAARQPEPKPALDLSLHPDVFDLLPPLEPLNDLSSPLLPPLFGEKTAPESPFQINGKLITNEREDDYWQSVEGAQLQFEFKQ